MESFYVDGARQLNAMSGVIRIEYVNLRRDGEQIVVEPSFEVVMSLHNFEGFRNSINELYDKLVAEDKKEVPADIEKSLKPEVPAVSEKKRISRKK